LLHDLERERRRALERAERYRRYQLALTNLVRRRARGVTSAPRFRAYGERQIGHHKTQLTLEVYTDVRDRRLAVGCR
jgi:hypothetical protein